MLSTISCYTWYVCCTFRRVLDKPSVQAIIHERKQGLERRKTTRFKNNNSNNNLNLKVNVKPEAVTTPIPSKKVAPVNTGNGTSTETSRRRRSNVSDADNVEGKRKLSRASSFNKENDHEGSAGAGAGSRRASREERTSATTPTHSQKHQGHPNSAIGTTISHNHRASATGAGVLGASR